VWNYRPAAADCQIDGIALRPANVNGQIELAKLLILEGLPAILRD
jgi:hypothetical protein